MAPVTRRAKENKFPKISEILSLKKRYNTPRQEPVWIYLEKEMRDKVHIKPYNDKVGIWLNFLKELRFYRYCQQKRYMREIKAECGPRWFCEFSNDQKEALACLKAAINLDLNEERSVRTRKLIWTLGVTLKIPKYMLINALKNSERDPGIFMWNLYSMIYNQSPSVLKESYDYNAKMLLSALVFIDLKECIETMEGLFFKERMEIKRKKKRPPPEETSPIPYGAYLCDLKVIKPKLANPKKRYSAGTFGYKIKLRSKESYDRLMQSTDFLEQRKQRARSKRLLPRTGCDYNFWVPTVTYKKASTKKLDYLAKLEMLARKATMRLKPQTNNYVTSAGGVAYNCNKPTFVIDTLSIMPTGYIHINGGTACVAGENGKEYVTMIDGYASCVKNVLERQCDCMTQWERTVQYINQSRCKCGHAYDYYNEKKPTEKYIHPPNKYGHLQLDVPLMYQMNAKEELIKNQILRALRSDTTPNDSPAPSIVATSLKPKELLAVLLADMADTTPLMIPHLPNANSLVTLIEWVRRRVDGPLTSIQHKNLMCHSHKRWSQLDHMDFRALAYRIPFPNVYVKRMDWTQKKKLQKLFTILLDDFVTRNRLAFIEESRMWWSTMKGAQYPSKHFHDIFFTLMPNQMKDIHLMLRYDEKIKYK